MKHIILTIEDNHYLRGFIARTLREAHYEVLEADCGEKALSILEKEVVDLVLLDLGLDDMNGSQILEMLRRQNSDIPVIIISSIDEIDTKVRNFERGCDDYLTKPFYREELLARIRRHLAKSYQEQSKELPNFVQRINVGPFTVNTKSYEVYKQNQKLEMNRKLYDLFLYFVQHMGQVLSKSAIFNTVWGYEEDLNIDTIIVHIHRLRIQIEDNYKKPKYLLTVKGLGYKFILPEEDQ